MRTVADGNRFDVRNTRPPPLDDDATPHTAGQTVT
jgi:hypothetical protein